MSSHRPLRNGSLHGAQWLGFGIFTMPLFAWFIGSMRWLFGKMGGAGLCIYARSARCRDLPADHGIAQTLNPRIAVPAAIMATLNPTQIVLSGLVLTDTILLFFSLLFLLAAARWLKRARPGAGR